MLKRLKLELGELYQCILYIVIQGGTSLSGNNNIGIFNEIRFKEMINIVKNDYGKLSKEHNGDYQSLKTIKRN